MHETNMQLLQNGSAISKKQVPKIDEYRAQHERNRRATFAKPAGNFCYISTQDRIDLQATESGLILFHSPNDPSSAGYQRGKKLEGPCRFLIIPQKF